MVSIITLNSPATPFRSIAVRGMWFHSMWFRIMTVCDSALWQYVIPHHDSVWFHLMTLCEPALWQYVFPHYDGMWFRIMTVCVSALWQYVIPYYDGMWFCIMTVNVSTLWQCAIPHYDGMWFRIMTVCDSTLWQCVIPCYDYVIPQYTSLQYILLHCMDSAERYFKHFLWELCSKIPAWKRTETPVNSCKKSVCIYLDRLVSETMNLVFCLFVDC